jgi:hypothetical protein
MTPMVQWEEIAILWNPATVILEKIYSTTWTLLDHYLAIGSSKEGVLANAYGAQIPQEKDNFLKNLSTLGNLLGQERWIIGGYFNIILSL